MEKVNLDNFFNECKKYQHYEKINKRPNEYSFGNWKKDNSECRMYSKWILEKSNLPSLKLDIPIPNLDEIVKEATNAIKKSVKHRGKDHPGWRSITLHGLGTEVTEDWNASLYEGKFGDTRPKHDWTDLAKECPATVDWLETHWHYNEFHRVRFMLMEPGGFIQPHQDHPNRRLAAVNVAITNPPEVEFAIEEAGLIPWEPGDVRAIDIGRKHSVRNLSNKDRIHMIIHGHMDIGHQKVICRSYDQFIEKQGV